MKLKKYSWLAALPLLFTACQDDMLVEKHSQQGVYTLTATMDGGINSRAQIVLNGTSTTKESFHWNEGDKFTLFQNTDLNNDWSKLTWATHEFSIDASYDDSTPAASVDFSTTDSPNMLLQGNKFVAIYPNLNVRNDAMNVVYMEQDQELEDNSESSWKDYFKKNMFMLADGVIAGNSVSTNVKFQHLCGLIRITYTNDTGVDKNVKRIFMDGQWTSYREYFINDEDRLTNYNYDFAPEEYGLTFTGEEGAVVPAGKSADFYFLFFPVESQMMQTISVMDMDGNVKTTPSYRDMKGGNFPFVFESGKCYWMKITDNGEELMWTKFLQGSGDDNVTNKVIEVSTFSELKQALAVQANELIVVLKDNIELETPLSITSPTNLDLRGYELSIADNYETREMNAVFDVHARLTVNNGSLKGKDGANLHDYYFKLNGSPGSLSLSGVSLNTGTAITNAVFMDDDNFRLEDYMIWNETDQTETAIPSSIVTTGNAIHYVAKEEAPQFWSYINGNITGDIYIETKYTTLNAMMLFQSGTINGNLNTANVNSSLDISEYIRKANVVSIGSGYTGWDKAGLYVEDQRYEVSTFAQLKTAFEAEQDADEVTYIILRDDITLESPLIATKPIDIVGRGSYTLILSENFDWSSGADAAIIVEGENPEEDHLYMDDLIMKGSMTSAESKYLVKTKKSRLNLNNTSLVGNGIANAAYLEDADMNIHNATYISVEEDGYALYFCANTRYVQANINTTEEIVGNVGFTANVINDMYPNIVALRSGSINGDFSTDGTCADSVMVRTENGAVVNGTGWNEVAIAQMQIDFKERGGAHTENLVLNEQDVIFSVGKVNDNSVNFHAQTLDGSGTIKFVNDTGEKVTLYVNVENLSDDVNFVFEGKFRKILNVHTTRVEEFFEMAENTDQINVYLSDDVVLNQQVVTNKNLLWTDGSEGNEEQGMLALCLEGHTLTTSLDVPAIVLQGGFLHVEGGNIGSGTVNASTEFVQIGAETDESNNTIAVAIHSGITLSSNSGTWMYVSADGTEHKDVTVYIDTETLTNDQRVAKVRVDESYIGKVTVCGVDKSNVKE